MADKHPKRPRDLNQWAKRMTDIVSGEVETASPRQRNRGKTRLRSNAASLAA